MKICHYLSSSTFAGIEQHVAELAASQQTTHDVTILCDKAIGKHYKDFNVIDIKNSTRRSLLGAFRIYKILKLNKFDIIHAHASKPVFILSVVKYFLKFKFIASIHGVKSNNKIFNYADYVIGGNKNILNEIQSPNSVIHNWYRSSSVEKHKSIHALAVGRLEKVKGFDLLIKSWVNIKTPLLIVGSSKEKESLVALIKELNLTNKISITNWVEQEELFKLYARSNVLIISSKSEGGPRVALEALANNLPVLSTDVGHMNLILPQEILAEPDNLESLQSLMESYVDNITNLNQESIFEFVKQEFSLEKQADKVMKVYLSVLNKDS